MHTHTNRLDISYAPTDTTDLYPETDGKPIRRIEIFRPNGYTMWLGRRMKMA